MSETPRPPKNPDEVTPERVAMLDRRAELLAQHPKIKRARDLAPLMGEHEREYWMWVLDTMEQDLTLAGLPAYTEVKGETR